jgi:hypothetical protein
MTPEPIRPAEARLAKASLAAAYQALQGQRISPIRWLALVQRQFHPNSPTGRIAGLLAAMAPDHADVRLRDLSGPAMLIQADTRSALAALGRAGFLTTRPTMRSGAMEMTLKTPGASPSPEKMPEGGQVA